MCANQKVCGLIPPWGRIFQAYPEPESIQAQGIGIQVFLGKRKVPRTDADLFYLTALRPRSVEALTAHI